MNTVMTSREEMMLSKLLRFYKQDPQHLNILAAISKQKTIISLREMDYAVTNYSDNNKVIYTLKNDKVFNMYLDYKCELKGCGKKCLDPFCRRQRIFLDFETKTPKYIDKRDILEYKKRTDGVVTTIGQLNFFSWAITNEIIDYCFNNKEKIDKEMEEKEREKKRIKKKMSSKSSKSANIPDKKDDKCENDSIKLIVQF